MVLSQLFYPKFKLFVYQVKKEVISFLNSCCTVAFEAFKRFTEAALHWHSLISK